MVLVVREAGSERDRIASALSEAGCGILAAGTAEEALALMGDAAFPVVVAGLDLPGSGGIEFLKEARRLHPESEVIIVAKESTVDSAVSAIRAGACDYLSDPQADPGVVTAAVARAVDRARLVRERNAQVDTLVRKNDILQATNEFLSEQVKRDSLTGLYNHRYFQDILARETSRATRYNRVFTILFADLDHFKHYNDHQGHLAGDKALIDISEILQNSIRKSDFVARYGGEEFVVLLTETAKEKALVVAERIRKAVESQPFEGREAQPGGALTVSIGLSSFPEDGRLPNDLIQMADLALYAAKREGGNSYRMTG